MKNPIAYLLLLSSFSAFSDNSTYQASAGVSLLNMETEASTFSGYFVSASVALDSVDYTKGPLELAEYLNKTSALRVSASQIDLKSHNFDDSKSTAYSVSPTIKLAENLLVGVGYSYSKSKDNNGFEYPSRERYSAGLTYYLTDSSTIGSNISEFEGRYSYRVVGTKLMPLQNDDKLFLFASLELDDEVQNDQEITTNIEAKYYPNNKLSLSADFYNYSVESDDGDGNQLNFQVGYFISPKVELAAVVGRSIRDINSEDYKTDLVSLNAGFRF
jgi:hypothetical protein